MPSKELAQIPSRVFVRRVEIFCVNVQILFSVVILISCNQTHSDLRNILKSTDTIKISSYHGSDTSVYIVTGQKDLDIFTQVINGKKENLPSDSLIGRIQYYSKGQLLLNANLSNKVTIQYVYDKVLYGEKITYQAGMLIDQFFSTFASANNYMDPLSLLRRVVMVDDIGPVTISGNFSDNWIKSSDVETLIPLVKNKSKCVCLLDPISSHIPLDSIAEVGGYAIQWIKAFKENRNYSFRLYTCPKVNTAEADSLIKWWSQEMSKPHR